MAKKPNTARGLIDGAKRREATLPLCLRGDLVAEYEQAEAELEHLTRDAGWAPQSLAEDNPTIALAERVTSIQAEMAESTVTLRFRALKRHAWQSMLDKHRNESGGLNVQTLEVPMIAACLIDPVMSEAEVDELLDVINEGQREALFGAAYSVNQEATAVPFSERASAVNRWREQSKKSPEPTASPEASS